MSALSANPVWRAQVIGDTNYRLSASSNGYLLWGSGSATEDVRVHRTAAKTLTFDDAASGAGTFNFTGNVFASTGLGIGISSLVASAIFQVDSTTKGILFPRMTTAQRDAISSPADALLAYDSTLHKYKYYDSTAWKTFATTTSGPAVETIGVMLVGTTSYTSGVQASVISTMSGTKTIAANSLQIGQSIELIANGLTSGVTSGGSGVIDCKFGPLNITSTSMANSAGGVSSLRNWSLVFKVTRVASSSITISAVGYWEDLSHAVQSMRLYYTPLVQTGFDFTVDNDIDVLYPMTASGGNSYSFDAANLTISKYN